VRKNKKNRFSSFFDFFRVFESFREISKTKPAPPSKQRLTTVQLALSLQRYIFRVFEFFRKFRREPDKIALPSVRKCEYRHFFCFYLFRGSSKFFEVPRNFSRPSLSFFEQRLPISSVPVKNGILEFFSIFSIRQRFFRPSANFFLIKINK
jgi:hypothetical protein